MTTGKIVKTMDNGFGFIEIEGQEKNLFFHMNELQNVEFDDLKIGDTLSFEIVDGPKGPAAANVSKV